MNKKYKCSIKYVNDEEIMSILNNIEKIAKESNSENFAKIIIKVKPYINRVAKTLMITPNELFSEWIKYHNLVK